MINKTSCPLAICVISLGLVFATSAHAYSEIDKVNNDAKLWNSTDLTGLSSISTGVILTTSYSNLHPDAKGVYDSGARDPLAVASIKIESNVPADLCFGTVGATRLGDYIDRSDNFTVNVDDYTASGLYEESGVGKCYALDGYGDVLAGTVTAPGQVGAGVWRVSIKLYSRYR